jgi:AraC-like DNA-binding protein
MLPSTLSSVVLLITKALDAEGIDSRQVLIRAGLNPAHLNDSNARYSFPAVTHLWKTAAQMTGDPCFGFKAASFWHPTTLHALGYTWLASDTLGDALQRAARYIRIANTALTAVFEETEIGYRFTTNLDKDWRGVAPADEAIDATIALILDMCRSCYGAELNPILIEVTRPEVTKCVKQYQKLCNSTIHYSSKINAIYFSKTDVTQRLPTANAELARTNEKIIVDYLARLDKNNITTRVKAKLLELLPSGHFTEEDIIQSLHLSQRTLQRKLKDEGTTFKEVLDETRKELAKEYVNDSSLSFSEITYLLGFSEQSNFTRAFRRWHNQSPSGYREKIRMTG